jgi:hypothetical protein
MFHRGMLVLLALGLFGILQTSGAWITLGWLKYLLYLVPLAGLVVWLQRKGPGVADDATALWQLAILLGVLFGYLYSSATKDFYYFFATHDDQTAKLREYRGLLKDLAIGMVVLAPLFLYRKMPWWKWTLPVILLVSIYLAGDALFAATGGEPIYRDDHPSFIQRFTIFGQTFPQILYYDPAWNAGRSTAYVVVCGALVPGILYWPFWAFGDVSQVYTPILFFHFCVAIPLFGLVAARLIGGSWTASWASAILVFASTRYFLLWMLHYGTIGFSFAIPFLLIASACIYRILWMDKREWWIGILLVLSSVGFLAWPAAVLMGVPLAVAMALSWRRLDKGKLIYLGICAVCIALLLLPILNAVLNHTAAAQLASLPQDHLSLQSVFIEGWGQLVQRLRNGNPLTLFLGILGVFFLRQPAGLRLFFGTIIIGFLLEISFIGQLRPESELKRTAVPLFLMAAIPAGIWIDHLFRERQKLASVLQAMVLMLLLLGALNMPSFYSGKRLERFSKAQPYISEFADWAREHVPDQGRLLFAGPTRHAYSGAHVALFPILTGKEMMAVDFYSFSEKLVNYTYPPLPWRNTTGGTYEWLQLFGVSHVVAYEERELKFYRRTPQMFKPVFEFGTDRIFYVFEVVHDDKDRFFQGEGTVDSAINKLVVKTSDEDVVIKYLWNDGLKADGDAELYPVDVAEGIQFIGIHTGGRKEINLSYHVWK